MRGRFGAGRFGGGDLVGGNLVLYRLIDVQYSPNELDPGSKTLFLSFLEDPVQGLCILLLSSSILHFIFSLHQNDEMPTLIN